MPSYYPNVFLPFIPESHRIAVIQSDIWPVIADHRYSLNKRFDVKVCAVKVQDDGTPPTVCLANERGVPVFKVGMSRSRRKVQGQYRSTFTLYGSISSERLSMSEIANSVNISSLLSKMKPPKKDQDPSKAYEVMIKHRDSSEKSPYTMLRQLADQYGDRLGQSFDRADWALTREQEITLMAVYLNKINKSDVPDSTSQAINNAYEKMQRLTNIKSTMANEISDMFNRDKWCITYYPMVAPYSYYTVTQINCALLMKIAQSKAEGAFQHIVPDFSVHRNKFYIAKDMSDLPQEIRDDVCSSIAMLNMGRPNYQTSDPWGIMGHAIGETWQDLGAVSFKGQGNGYSILLLDK